MKKTLFFCLATALVLFTACAHLIMPADPREDSVCINIECRDENNLKQNILLQLRSIRAKDIKVDSDGGVLNIHAAFLLRDTPLYKIETVKADMEQTPGVLYTFIETNKSVVKQAF